MSEGEAERIYEKIMKSRFINGENKKLIEETYKKVLNRDRVKSDSSKRAYLKVMKVICQFKVFRKKSLKNATREDISKFETSLREGKHIPTEVLKDENIRITPQPLKHNSIAIYKALLKTVYQLMFNLEKGEYPKCVRHLRYSLEKTKIDPSKVLKPKDIEKLVAGADNVRDKALIKLLWDSGARAGEIANLRIKDVAFDGFSGDIHITEAKGNKSGARKVPILDSVPELKAWINIHPYNDNDEAPLWVSKKANGDVIPIKSTQFHFIIEKAEANAKTGKKKINPHWFRHSRITWLKEKGMDSAEIKKMVGHCPKSNIMDSVYVHTGYDLTKKEMLKASGYNPQGKKPEPVIKGKLCFKCGNENSHSNKFCGMCGSQIIGFYDLQDKLDILDRIKTIVPVLEALNNSNKFNEALAEIKIARG